MCTDVPVITAFGKGKAHVRRVGFVQQDVQYEQSCSHSPSSFEIRDTLLKCVPSCCCGQLLYSDCRVLINASQIISKIRFNAQSIDVGN